MPGKSGFFTLFLLALTAAAVLGCGSASAGSTAAVSALSFSDMALILDTTGQSENLFSVRARSVRALAASSSSSSAYAIVQFALGSSSSASSGAAAIYGFNVYRSTDGSSWTKAGTKNYGAATSLDTLSASAGSTVSDFTYYDTESAFARGTTYYYKVQAFDGDGNLSVESPVAEAVCMEPFTVALAAPSNGTATAVTSSARTFSFTLSNTALWDSSASDYFYFSLLLKQKSGSPVYYGEFRYNFSTSVWQRPGGYASGGAASWSSPVSVSGITYSGGTVSVDLTASSVLAADDSYVARNYGAFALTSGYTYEWDVFGDWYGSSYDSVGTADSMDAAFFAKVTSGASGTGYGISYANTYANGEGSANGAFSFSY